MGKRDKRKRRARRAGAGAAGGPSVTTSKASPPPRDRLLKQKLIAIGQVEELAGGRELRCFVDGDRVGVAVFEGGALVGPSLWLDCPPALRVPGQSFDEGEFTRVVDSYYIHSPWHDGEHTTVALTIDSLRHGGEPELLTNKDL